MFHITGIFVEPIEKTCSIVNSVDIATFVVSHRATEAQRFTEGNDGVTEKRNDGNGGLCLTTIGTMVFTMDTRALLRFFNTEDTEVDTEELRLFFLCVKLCVGLCVSNRVHCG